MLAPPTALWHLSRAATAPRFWREQKQFKCRNREWRMNDGSAGRIFSQQEVIARLERLPLSSWQVKTRIVVGTATFFDAFDALAIAYILPAIIPLWQLAPADIGWLISTGYVGQLIGALAGGWLAERFGRRPVIFAAILWFGLLSIACAFAWSYQSLLVLRALQGLGLGAEVPVAATYISELAKARGRGRFVLLFELIFPVGIVMAALLGRWIVPHLGWQYMSTSAAFRRSSRCSSCACCPKAHAGWRAVAALSKRRTLWVISSGKSKKRAGRRCRASACLQNPLRRSTRAGPISSARPIWGARSCYGFAGSRHIS
jgi:MFS family permease